MKQTGDYKRELAGGAYDDRLRDIYVDTEQLAYQKERYRKALEKIEEMLDHELPGIGDRIPHIISGPTYKGVTEIKEGHMTLNIEIECRERYYGKVRADVNREIHRLFTENKIEIL